MPFRRLQPFTAPKRYVFKDPDTGFEYEEKSLTNLVRRITSYRAQNQLPPLEHLELVLPNYWCSLPENEGNCEFCPSTDKKSRIKRGLYSYIKGGIALIDTLTYPEKHIVSQEIADKRAERCINCVYNRFPDKDLFLEWADEIAEASVGSRRSKHHEELGNCEICSCPLRAKVFYKGAMRLDEEQVQKMRNVNCWQPEEDEGAEKEKRLLEINSRKAMGR